MASKIPHLDAISLELGAEERPQITANSVKPDRSKVDANGDAVIGKDAAESDEEPEQTVAPSDVEEPQRARETVSDQVDNRGASNSHRSTIVPLRSRRPTKSSTSATNPRACHTMHPAGRT